MTEEQSLLERVGQKLTKMRTDRKLTGDEVAKGADVGRRSLTRWETGQGVPTGKNLEKLAKYYGVSESWIMK